MSARETLNRWVEAMQILCGNDDNPGQKRRDSYDEYRQPMLNAAYSEVVAERDAMTVAWLTKRAREYRAAGETVQADTAAVLASKVARGAVRANNLRMLPADFFEPGHTYAAPGLDWKFRCDSVTTHPEDAKRTALGWRFFDGEWEAIAYGEDDWDIHQYAGHTDVTEAGAS